MTLLQRLQSALNKVYDGNTIASDEAKQDGVSHKDQYKCPACLELYDEDYFNHEAGYCRECWQEHWGDMPGHDELEYKKGDR
jgi:hypothetical protein